MDQKQNMSANELRDCLKRIASGEIDALRELYDVFYYDVFRFILSLCKDYHLSEDLTQDVFLRVQKFAKGYHGGNPRSWLFTVARNVTFDSLKRRGRELAEEDEKLHFLIDSVVQVETTDLDFVERTLGAGLRHTEIAAVIGLPYPKVRATYAYALKKMRKGLEGELD